ncbi:MAG: DUF4065 domain-containing protein [[Clostridium] spiroforme]|uniref:Panacea domain-containing protein n=1 Tax=Thomasclavelia spiroformis TaxID=29348 RepID=UPI001D289476|nr:type II toxin-antitoxin system antitoxin SocA domain-containing protein [Thomasclavelia spiroformis]MBS7217743.1 DUF4065 domain-containing protein [Thomasclavelia spiroformis]
MSLFILKNINSEGEAFCMYNALSIARYIIDFYNQHNRGISNLKLQKVLYFVQAEFLVGTPDHRACFLDPIEAWDFGPVVPSVYHQYKIYGSGIIPSDNNDILKPYYDRISEDDQEMINNIVEATFDYTASELVNLTHNQAPWKDAYRKGFNNEIPKQSILNYFKE